MRGKADVADFARFFAKVDQSGPHWLWTGAVHGGHGARDNHRCGSFWYQGRARSAHVWIWKQVYGRIPAGLQVNHKCGKALCVKPGHMYLGTQAQNMQDMHNHGQAIGRQRGEKVRKK